MVLERTLQALGLQAATLVVGDHRLELADEARLDLADGRLLRGGRNDDRAAAVDGAVDRRAGVDGVVEAVAVGVDGVAVAVGAGREDDVVGEDRGDVATVDRAGVQRAELHRGSRLDRREREGVVAGREAVDVRCGVQLNRVGTLDLVADAEDDLTRDGRDLDLHHGGRVGARPRRERDDRELGLDGLCDRCRDGCSPDEERDARDESAEGPTHVGNPLSPPKRSESVGVGNHQKREKSDY